MSSDLSDTHIRAPHGLWSERKTCRLCGSRDLQTRIDMAPMAVATLNFNVDARDRNAPIYSEGVPMPLDVCGSCGTIQIRFIGNPEVQYRNYAYTTTLSLGLPEHFLKAARHLSDHLQLGQGSRVVEFGSNDGTYLRAFHSLGMTVVGIDPAVRIAEAATSRGIQTYPDFFSMNLVQTILREHGPADLLVANNVIANIDDLPAVFAAARELLSPSGAFVFETQYGRDVLDGYLLDTVYHEHLTYFSVAPLRLVLGGFGLEVFDVERIPTKGGSIRVYVQRRQGPRPIQPAVAALADAELADGVYGQPYFDAFAAGIEERRRTIQMLVDESRAKSGKVAGYGASVGTATLLAQFGLIGKIDFLVDDDPGKPSEMIGPGYQLAIRPRSALLEEGVSLAVVFAWRYIESIRKNNPDYVARGGKFLVPLPQPHVV